MLEHLGDHFDFRLVRNDGEKGTVDSADPGPAVCRICHLASCGTAVQHAEHLTRSRVLEMPAIRQAFFF